MANQNEKYLAHLKYYGRLVDEGFLDAKKSAQALIGFDEILRYFLCQEDKNLSEVEFEIPVKIQQGSWIALIPENIQEWITTTIGIGASTYAIAAAKKMADNDFKNVGLNTLFKSAFKGMIWVIKIANHLGTIKKKKIENPRFRDNNQEIGIVNDNGDVLWVEKKYIDYYVYCPDKLFSKVSQIIEPERTMEVSLIADPEQTIKVTYDQKRIFDSGTDDSDEIVLPELIHGTYVELDGYVTRGNQNTNTLGFLFNNHILTCHPQDGSITRYKEKLFTHCIMKGYVDRHNRDYIVIEKKPRIIFIDIILIDDRDSYTLDFIEHDNDDK